MMNSMMNPSTSGSASAHQVFAAAAMLAAPVDEDRPPVSSHLAHQLEVVREMLRDLETQTGAGQRHVMAKVVRFISEELRKLRLELAGQRADTGHPTLGRTIERLAREAERPAPAVRPFRRRAELVLAVLAIAA